MSKLVASKGVINAEDKWESGPMTVKFVRRAINPLGALGRVELTIGDSRTDMTFAQAISLANEIIRRCGEADRG